MAIGPVQLIVLGFVEPDFHGDIGIGRAFHRSDHAAIGGQIRSRHWLRTFDNGVWKFEIQKVFATRSFTARREDKSKQGRY